MSFIFTEQQEQELRDAHRAAVERIAKLYDYDAEKILTATYARSFGSRALHWDAREERPLYWEAFKLASERSKKSEAA